MIDNDIFAFIAQMPEDMKRQAINGLEFLRGVTIADYKAKQIEAVEALLTDVQNNPGNYSTASLNEELRKTVGYFKISKELERRVSLVEHFIAMKSIEVVNGTQQDRERVERNHNMTFDDFLKEKQPKK